MILAFLVLLWAAPPEPAATALTFPDALAMARQSRAAAGAHDEIPTGRRLPDVRIETTGNTSRTLDPFTASPLLTDAISSILAVDFPLLDGGVRRARLDAIEARQRRSQAVALDEGTFNELVEAFGDLYLAQRQQELLGPLQKALEEEATRAARLLRSGEIANLEAARRRSMAASATSQRLDLESRHEDAAARLGALLGLTAEPVVSLDPSVPPPGDGIVFGKLATAGRDERLAATAATVEADRARLRELDAPPRLTALVSGFAGVTSAHSEFNDLGSSGTYGVYGLRLHLSYPLFRNTQLAAAEARLAVRESERQQQEASLAAGKQLDALRRQAHTSEQQIELLQQQTEEARLTAASVHRLADAGLRPHADVTFAEIDLQRRQAEVLAAQVQRWKTMQRLLWLAGSDSSPQP